MIASEQSYQRRDQAPPGLHRLRLAERPRGTARIAACRRSCDWAACGSFYVASSSSLSPSKGSLSCTGTRAYGGAAVNGLGASRLSGLATSRSIGQSLASGGHNGAVGTFVIFDAEGRAVAIAEVKFGEIAVQMPLTAMLVDAPHPTFEDRIEAFNGVGVRLASHIF